MVKRMKALLASLWPDFVSLDEAANRLLGGHKGETLSSRMGRNLKRCVLCRCVCWLLNYVQPNHCVRSIQPKFVKEATL